MATIKAYTDEIWKDVTGWEGLYQVSSFGRVKSFRKKEPHLLSTCVGTQNFFKPTIVDKNRLLRGDYFKKPTAYWFFNCKPTYGCTYQKDKKPKRVNDAKSAREAGLCSEERSMISPDYARNFICDFILGKEQEQFGKQLSLF